MTYRFLRAKGAGINSIPVRFSLAATLFSLCSSAVLQLAQGATINLWFHMANMGTAAIGGLIFFAMGKMLTRPLHKLEDVVQAVAEGLESNISDLDCSCEVGVLGDSISAMINRLRERERAISASREDANILRVQLVDAIDALGDQFLLFDQNDTLVLANRAFRTAMAQLGVKIETGITFNQMIEQISVDGNIGGSSSERLAWRNRQFQIRSEALASDHPIDIARDDGVTTRISVYRTTNGNIVDIRSDVTEEKKRQRVMEVALEKAEAGDRTKSEFLANMSHEIRTPMNGVIGMAELLANTDLDEKQRIFTDVIVRSGNALMSVINDILDFSKLSAGQMVLDNAAFDPRLVVNDVAQLLAARIAEKDLELIVRVDPLLPEAIIGDKGRFRQVLTNLVGNAVKFTEFGHILVEVSPSGKQSGLMVKIKDTGCGIAPEQHELIFEHFRQADNSSTRKFDGTGLGLSISRRLARLMGGEISVSSGPDAGSTFVFHAPLEHAGTVRQIEKRLAVRGDVPARILVIDDNPINRELYSELLAHWGFEAASASDGALGLDILKKARELGVAVDLIIMDFAMPGMNGMDTAKLVRKDESIAGTPILLLTSMDFSAGGDLVKDHVIDAWLTKPAREADLHREILNLLGQHSRTPSRPATSSTRELAAQLKTAIKAAVDPDCELDVLVAEDNPVNQLVIEQILETSGLTYAIVDNGRVAVETWRARSPRLIVMDISMPVVNGHEATMQIRAEEVATGRHVPILAVTAHAMHNDHDKALESGMDDFVTKPISRTKLLAKIEEWLPKLDKRNVA